MTTRVKIEITEAHNPVEIRVIPSGVHYAEVLPRAELRKVGDSYETYVHSGQRLDAREINGTPQER